MREDAVNVPRGGRPRAHTGASDAESLILNATESLLETVQIGKLSVAQIIESAGVSRATFYFYFSSKYAVITALLARVMDEIYEQTRPFVENQGEVPIDEALRASLDGGARVWQEHRFVLRATHEQWHAVPELHALWGGIVRRFTDGVSGGIDRGRAAGILPEGANSRQLAAALLWGTERCFYVAGLGADEDLPSEEEIVETLVHMWTAAVYGGPPVRA
ncbi:MAG: TetR/AcrR family transcriptional regulator, ethionamide resistance regulator [Solirubrobacteraceae bacterium]|jgi:AcrR family transcriptional regulator|nr:TetR/AcrR family transcriptional regulator, ethionamide resistance regulator [Solirubrobacteraceae bacterium]